MSIETCKLCNKESTPCAHINGHICQDCYINSKENKWISVNDKLPIETTFRSIFIVTKFNFETHKSFVEPLHYIGGQWFEMIYEEPLSIEYKVTHWMPLPEPPND